MGMFSMLGDIMIHLRGYNEYMGVFGDLRRYHEYVYENIICTSLNFQYIFGIH